MRKTFLTLIIGLFVFALSSYPSEAKKNIPQDGKSNVKITKNPNVKGVQREPNKTSTIENMSQDSSKNSSKIYPIVIFDKPILHKRCNDIKPGTDVTDLVKDMFETMYHANGVGLAAPQIGLDLNIIVIDFYDFVEEGKKRQVEMINPKLFIDEKSELVAGKEGCLSLPGIVGSVLRRSKITVKYFDRYWQEHCEVYEDFAARIVQHEYDHLNGKLFIEYLEDQQSASIQQQLEKIKNKDKDILPSYETL
jgi:peptide deformylase